ncbi:MAG: hypothetical protein FWF78_08005 [Defluviitaleaceae bacterium]|nr:hypothetical protein [Defluviitaleaceae bacterium]
MVVLNTQYNLMYPRLSDIRRRIVAYEDALKGEFLQYQILPIPDDAPPEIPRVTITTKHGHSMLQLSLSGAVFQTAYDDAYNKSWEKCHDYLEKRMEQIYDIVKHISPERIYTQGITAQIIVNIPDTNPVEFLTKGVPIIDKNQDIWDFGCYATVISQNKYFATVQISNARIAHIPLSAENYEHKNYLLFNIEANDRKMFNQDSNNDSGKETTKDLLSLMKEIVTVRIDAFISGGVFKL